MSRSNGTGAEIDQAIAAMRREFKGNDWMLGEHWPLNEPHVRLMIADVMSRFPPGPNVRALDVGCFNGYISFLFKQLGYQVTGTDIYELDHRDALFARAGIEFVHANMNHLHPFRHLAAKSFDYRHHRSSHRTHLEPPARFDTQSG